jgi:hypothetical protein
MALVNFLENPLRNFRQASTHSAPQSLTPPLIRRSQALPPSPQQAELFLLSDDGSAPMESELPVVSGTAASRSASVAAKEKTMEV